MISDLPEAQIVGGAKLRWYFERGQAVFERSTTGAILERSELFAYSGERDGRGRARRVKRHSIPDPTRRKREHAAEPWDANPITAQPRASRSADPAGYEPDPDTLTSYADVSRALQVVERADPRAAAALEAYFGDHGARHEWLASIARSAKNARPAGGRMMALYHLTQAGAELLGRASRSVEKKASRGGGSLPHLTSAALRADTPDRRCLQAAADLQARALLSRAIRLWNAAWDRGS